MVSVFAKRLYAAALAALILAACLPGLAKTVEPKPDYSIISRLILNILSDEHYAGQPVGDKLSKQLFDEYLALLDPAKLYFTQQDVDRLGVSSAALDDALKRGDVEFAYVAYNLMLEKLKKREDFARKALTDGFDFTLDDAYVFDRAKSPWAKDERELDDVWIKKLKYDILNFRLMQKAAKEDPEAAKEAKAVLQNKSPEERVLKRLSAYRKYLEDNDSMQVLELYLSCLSRLYDPHSAYMSPRSNEDFNIQMKLSLVGIGALLSAEDGYTKVVKVMAGGPAEKDGRLKADDRIIAVSQGSDGEPVDVMEMPLNNVVNMIRGKKGSKVRLTILEASKGAQAIPKELTLVRDEVPLKDQEASGDIREIKEPDGRKAKVGVIKLPSFYYDFEGAMKGKSDFKSSTRDVRQILEKFTQDGVDGVVMDLRSNGGGSLKEAIDLTGLFIYTGPVVQIRNQKGAVRVENDLDPLCYYNGPLLVVVNRMSASATEIFAGAIQDYGRGIVVGEKHTHGKGTVQTVFDLDPILSRFGMDLKSGSVKLTNAKFYRISGSSTQNKGVTPDIEYDSFTDYMDIGESKLEHALPWDQIDAAKYSSVMRLDDYIPALRAASERRRTKDDEFKKLAVAIGKFKELKDKKSVSLNEQKRWEQYNEEKKVADEQESLYKDSEDDSTDSAKKDKKDIFLDESVRVLADYMQLRSKDAKTTVKNIAPVKAN